MIALYIILAILLLIIALFSLKSSVVLTYKNDVELKLSVLGIKFDLYPKKQKKIKKRKKLLKGKKAKKSAEANSGEKKEKGSLLDSLDLIKELLSVLLKKANKRIKLKASKIIINVATGDAAKTALLFTAVNNTLALIIKYLEEADKLTALKKSQISVKCDFISEKSSADIEILFTLRVWHVAEILLATALKYVTLKNDTKNQN